MTEAERSARDIVAKVPAVTLGFWIIKIIATTLGETGADLFTQQYEMGYLAGIALFTTPLVLLVVAQVRAVRFHPLLYWATILASTTAGTALADFFDRDLGIGYAGGSAALLACVCGSLLLWRLVLGSDTIETVGYLGGAALFGGLLAVIALLYWRTRVSRVALFWCAFVLTRPLGATLGDFLDKPLAQGGLDLGRDAATAVLVVAMALCLWRIPQRPLGSARS